MQDYNFFDEFSNITSDKFTALYQGEFPKEKPGLRFKPTEQQKKILDSNASVKLIAKYGRRTSCTTVLMVECINAALEGGNAAYLTFNRRGGVSVWSRVLELLSYSRIEFKIDKQRNVIHIDDAGSIYFVQATYARKFKKTCFDECLFQPEERIERDVEQDFHNFHLLAGADIVMAEEPSRKISAQRTPIDRWDEIPLTVFGKLLRDCDGSQTQIFEI